MGIEMKCEVCDRLVKHRERVFAESFSMPIRLTADVDLRKMDRVRTADVCVACAALGDGRTVETRVERIERPEILRVAYRMVCDVCELQARADASLQVAHKYVDVPEAPKRENFRTHDAYAFAFMIDLSCGDAEKCAHNREIDEFERKAIHAPMRHDLSRRGCPHAYERNETR